MVEDNSPSFKEIKASKSENKRPSALKAIRAKCIDCCCGVVREISLCTVVRCPLYDFRMGKRPKSVEDKNE